VCGRCPWLAMSEVSSLRAAGSRSSAARNHWLIFLHRVARTVALCRWVTRRGWSLPFRSDLEASATLFSVRAPREEPPLTLSEGRALPIGMEEPRQCQKWHLRGRRSHPPIPRKPSKWTGGCSTIGVLIGWLGGNPKSEIRNSKSRGRRAAFPIPNS